MSSNSTGCRIAVVGGGIAGLATAFRLREEMRAVDLPGELVVYEESDVCGGATRTERIDGFALDRGPNGWLSNEPLTARLVGELGLTGELVRSNDAACHRFIYTRGKLHELPASPGKFLLSGLLRPWEKLRVVGEFFTRRRPDDDDETIYDFGCRRLGRGFAETMLDPMVSGIFAGNVRELSLPATFPKMRSMELEYGGLFKALIAKKREQKRSGGEGGGPAGPSGVLTTLEGGVGRFTEVPAETLAEHIRNNHPVSGLTRDDGEFTLWFDGAKERFDAVVMAVPAHAAAGIVKGFAPEAADALGGIGFADTVVVCHVYDSDSLPVQPDGFGHLIPRRDGIRALGCLWTSCIFPDQVPGNELLLRTILGGAGDPGIMGLSDEELLAVVRDNTATTLGIHCPPLRTWIFRHRCGIAQYTLGHRERVAVADKLCDEVPGLAFVGASYRGVSLNRCIRDAYTVAPRVLGRFGVDVAPIPEGADTP
ncbi:MAG: protoporphyrinogen oxidase [Phycisphaerae bacterium]|nr:protoporphyrinogen oxidase [Phycisphaerae bacterium]